jgi:hypothetical protein
MALDDLLRRKTLASNPPYPGVAVLPDATHFEASDPRNEQATVDRWRPVLERHGATILEVENIPTSGMRVEVDGITWELEPMYPQKTYDVPESVYHRIRALAAEGVPFAWWVWGEEKFSQPNFTPTPAAQPANAPSWSDATTIPLPPVQSRPAPRPRPTAPRQRDPIVVGIIPTGPNRGVWCLLGKWFH